MDKQDVKKEEGTKKKIDDFLDHTYKTRRTFGEKAADWISKWAGSWIFIISFFGFLVLWMTLNTLFIIFGIWDPKPFILLNLVLSCLAAIQAPIILMSQNRQSKKDRLKAEYDYRLNKKAEQEIRQIKGILTKHFGNHEKKK